MSLLSFLVAMAQPVSMLQMLTFPLVTQLVYDLFQNDSWAVVRQSDVLRRPLATICNSTFCVLRVDREWSVSGPQVIGSGTVALPGHSATIVL